MAPLVGDRAVAEQVWKAALDQGATKVQVIALFEACMVESGMRNLTYGDRDSLGVLQQRASWGSRETRLDPYASAVRFLNKSKTFEPWKGTPGQLAQKVQVSAFPLRYDAELPRASLWLIALGGQEWFNRGADKVKDETGVGAVQDTLGFVTSPAGLRRIALIVVGVLVTLAGVGIALGRPVLNAVKGVKS